MAPKIRLRIPLSHGLESELKRKTALFQDGFLISAKSFVHGRVLGGKAEVGQQTGRPKVVPRQNDFVPSAKDVGLDDAPGASLWLTGSGAMVHTGGFSLMPATPRTLGIGCYWYLPATP